MLVLGLAVAAVPAVRLTVDPHPEAPEHVDALLVLYSSPHVFDAAIELVDQGVTDHLIVSAHEAPPGSEALCGGPEERDDRLAGVTVECFEPDPVTTQGEVMHAAQRMRELGLESLGVLAFRQQVERARILAERCWTPGEGSVALYQYERPSTLTDTVAQTVYGTVAFGKVALTPGCADELPAVLQWPLDVAKRLRGQPVDARLVRTEEAG